MIIPEFCISEGNEEEEEEEEEEDTAEEYVDKAVDSKKASNKATNDKDIDFKVIKKEWKKVAEGIKPIHKHLYAFLDTSKPIKYEDGKLHIEVPFQFYKDQIDSPQSREAISQVLRDTFNISCRVECTVNEKAKPRMKSNMDVVLKNIPKKKEGKPEGNPYKPSLSADVEAIFEGM
jgi:chromosomal replication initiation ATPase DnaA